MGASVTIRKLVDEARRDHAKQDDVRKAQETTYRFMAAMAGDFNYYEEALRALYARDSHRFHQLIESWSTTEGDPTTARKVTHMKDDVTVNPCRDESLRAASGCY